MTAKTAAPARPFSPEQEEVLRRWTKAYPAPAMGLLEAMRQVQEWNRCVRPEHEEELAALFGLTLEQVHEVATFFPFFTSRPAGRKRLGLCRGLSCQLAGSQKAAGEICRRLSIKPGETTPDGEFSFEEMECVGGCEQAPALLVNEELKGPATPAWIEAVASGGKEPAWPELALGGAGTRVLTEHLGDPAFAGLEGYKSRGGYEGLKKALGMKPADLVEEVKRSNLRGLGGAGFGTGMKWTTVPSQEKSPGPRYVVANADESEPGCFKDRVLIKRSPHQILEGLLITSYVVGAGDAFIFIRGEYRRQVRALETALKEALAAGLIGENILGSGFSCRISLMRGAGAYICGLDTALLETMEGKKAWPRQPPPFPTAVGLLGRPTVVNNVETLAMLPHIVRNGGEWFAKLGTLKSGGTAVFSVSGHVERPGIYEFPMGTPLKDVIAAAGGVRGGRGLKAVIPGGASTPVLTAAEVDVPMDFEGLRSKGSFLGAGGVIVLDETVDMVAVAHNIERFLAHESCGQCTPCREGSHWVELILQRLLDDKGMPQDLPNLQRVGENITGKVICALGDTVGMVLRAFIQKFPEDFSARMPKPL